MSLLGGEDPKMKVTDYYVSVHYGLCHGPVDEFNGLWYGEKPVWEGNITGNTILGVAKGDLFGGNKVEGGLVGTFTFMPGGYDQVAPQHLLDALARNGTISSASMSLSPAYRGICSIYLTGGAGRLPGNQDILVGDDFGGNSGDGLFGNFAKRLAGAKWNANIGSNTAYIKPFWFKLRRKPKECPFETAINVTRPDGHVMKLANPAGIVYESMVNGEWGMGLSPTQLDDASFSAAAAALNSEGFGLGMLWHRQENVEDFIATVLDHIDASLCFDPFTGLFRLKLIRGDYDIDAVPVIGPGDATLHSFQRTGWGETVNEITVKWTSPLNEKPETVTVHDTANVSVQGGATIGETREYPGIRTAELALRVATRELLTASSSMATAELTINRRGYKLLPGDVVALNWPLYQFERLPMRVTQVDYGNPGDQAIKVNLIEDIFGMPEETFVESPGTGWTNPSIDPTPLIERHVFSIPFYSAVQKAGSVPAVQDVAPGDDFAVMIGTHDKTGVYGYDLVEAATAPDGTDAWRNWASVNLASRAEISGDLPRGVQSLVSLEARIQEAGFVPGGLAWLGPFNNSGEMVYIEDVDYSTWQVTLRRGVLDTVPREWPGGTHLWAMRPDMLGLLNDERSVGGDVTLRALTKTGNGRLPVTSAGDVTGTLGGRLHRPYRPAALAVDGVLWPDENAVTVFPATLTWSARNRLTETTAPTPWNAAGVTPVAGTTFEVTLTAEAGNGALTVFHTEDVGTATSYVIDPAATPPPANAAFLRARVDAKRDGLTNWQSVEHRVRLVNPPGNVSAAHVDVYAPGDLLAEAIDLNAPANVTAVET